MTDANNFATLNVKFLPISTKMSVEICNLVKSMPLSKARRLLQDVVDMKKPIPIKRFNADLGHKPGLGPARYPVNASKVFLKLLNSVEANAENRGLNVNSLVIVHAKADRGDARWRYGRKGRVKMKNTHIHLRVEEKNLEVKEENKK